jgi:hypothetical protein
MTQIQSPHNPRGIAEGVKPELAIGGEYKSESLPAGEREAHTGTNPMSAGDMVTALANVTLINNKSKGHFRDELISYISTPFREQKTPVEKVKKRPDGYDYVESSFMDYETKKFMPLYSYKLLHVATELGWITVIVSLTDRITGNIELGAGSARIQVSRGVETPGFRDVIDMGNNVKSALTNAIKNAQSRFGIASDVYQKRESIPTDAERDRFAAMQKEIHGINATRALMFNDQWLNLGTDWTEFLDRWQVYIDRNKAQKPAINIPEGFNLSI